ncbi:MAG: 3-deoxy-8-phosphooctulonate synthase [Bdellovibrionales bacterium GWB1_55_8]|nr:MAG: 3-deoxy-8-phosphooctulonate synthase [Bdellovibrionales bacterium GWB1_55_8]
MNRSHLMTVIAGPCVLEDDSLSFEIAEELKRQTSGLPIELTFKASFDKANRSSIDGFRGPGMEEGLRMLARVRDKTGLPLLTDFHTPEQAETVAEVVDFLQVPAFLCRQTDMIVAGASAALKHGRRLNVKKGQFLAPWDAKNIVEKVRAVETKIQKTPPRTDWFCLTERGTSFGYNTLVVDMSSFQCMQQYGAPVIHDATHSIQTPGGGPGGKSTGGKREYLEVLARAAIAAGADGIFLECHPRPEKAKSDGPNALPLEHVGTFLRQLLEIHALVRGQPKLLAGMSK